VIARADAEFSRVPLIDVYSGFRSRPPFNPALGRRGGGGALRASFSVDDGNEKCGEALDLCFDTSRIF
jgi:hypothetical protein